MEAQHILMVPSRLMLDCASRPASNPVQLVSENPLQVKVVSTLAIHSMLGRVTARTCAPEAITVVVSLPTGLGRDNRGDPV